MRRALFLTGSILAGLTAVAAGASPWTLGDCRPADQAKYDRFVATVKAAPPGSPIYIPKPYPASDAQVIGNFLYQYKSLHRERADPAKLPRGESALIAGITASTVTYTVQRVENWGADRCGREEKREFFHLVTIHDAASGAEIARVTVSPSGLWAAKTISVGAQIAPLPLTAPRDALRKVGEAYGLRGEEPQYVVTIGSIYCGFTTPCLAFRQGNDAYLYVHERPEGSLFKIAATEPRIALNPGDVQAARPGTLPALRTDGSERLILLGGSTWTIARKVPSPPVGTAHQAVQP
jgi:hypothetical protein